MIKINGVPTGWHQINLFEEKVINERQNFKSANLTEKVSLYE